MNSDELRAYLARPDSIDLLLRCCGAFVPDPAELPGWDDDGCEPRDAERIRLACLWHGVEEPGHITDILKEGAK